MKIYTITLNPVYDIFYHVPILKFREENQASSVSVFTGGKGVNVSRALLGCGFDTRAYLLLGHENCQPFIEGMTVAQIPTRLFYTEGRMRENVTLIDGEGNETRIVMNNFSANPETLDYILATLKKEVTPDDIIACCGRFPAGIPTEYTVKFVEELKAITDKVALDTKSIGLSDILKIAPWFIKPNEKEVESLVGYPCHEKEVALKAAEELHCRGIKHVLISMGGRGAVYCGELGKCTVELPKITSISTVGAGDSTVAGFIAGYSENPTLENCAKTACAYGTACCLEAGTNPPMPEKIKELYELISITSK